jgi:hypothetical protein
VHDSSRGAPHATESTITRHGRSSAAAFTWLISTTSTTAWRLAVDRKQMFGHVGDALRQRMHLRHFRRELRPYRRLEIADLIDCNYECAGSPDHAVLVVGPNSRRSERSERAFLFRQQRNGCETR